MTTHSVIESPDKHVSICLREIRSLASSRIKRIALKYNHQHKDTQGCSVEAVV